MSKKTKVMIIGPWVSGHIQNWLGDNDDYDIRVVTCHKVNKPSDSYPVYSGYVVTQALSFLLFPFFLLFHYISFKPSLCHVHFLSSYGLLSCWLPVKKIISIWGSDVNGRMTDYKILTYIYILILKVYSLINSPSKSITHLLVKNGIAPKNIFTLQYGVDLKKLESQNDIDKTKKCPDRQIVVSSIRNWDTVYQVERLIRLWSDLNPSEATLRIFGKTNDEQLREKICDLISNSGANIELIGFLEHDVFYQKLSESTAFISIPLMDGGPLSVFECMALSLTPIVSDIPANREWVTTEEACFLRREFSLSELKNSLETLKNNDFKCYLSHNKKLVFQLCDLKKNRAIMFNQYESLISKENTY